MRHSEHINEYAAALAKAQSEFAPIERTRSVKVTMKSGGSYTFDYAPLDAILAATMPALAKHGLSVSWGPETTYGDDFAEVSQTCRLTHSSGQWQEATVKLRTSEVAPQGMGSVLTYGRRYSFEHVAGVVSETDDDGNAASGNNAENAPRATMPDCPKCGNAAHVIKGKEEYGGGWLCWKSKGGCGHKWQGDTEELKAAVGESMKGKADEIAAQHGMTTGDKVQEPAGGDFEKTYEATHKLGLKSIDKLAKVADAVKLAQWIKDKRVAKQLDAARYHQLDALLAPKIIPLVQSAEDAKAAETLLRGLHHEMRISEGDYGDLALKLLDRKDELTAQPA